MCGFIEDWGKVLGMPQSMVYLREPEWVVYRREPEWVVYLRKPQWVVEMFWSRLSHKDNLLRAETVDCHPSLATLRERDKLTHVLTAGIICGMRKHKDSKRWFLSLLSLHGKASTLELTHTHLEITRCGKTLLPMSFDKALDNDDCVCSTQKLIIVAVFSIERGWLSSVIILSIFVLLHFVG